MELVPVHAVCCGILFGLPKHLEQELRRNGKDFFCPNGHTLTFNATENTLIFNTTKTERTDNTTKKERTEREMSLKIQLAAEQAKSKRWSDDCKKSQRELRALRGVLAESGVDLSKLFPGKKLPGKNTKSYAVLQLVRENPGLTARELSEKTDIKRSSVAGACSNLSTYYGGKLLRAEKVDRLNRYYLNV